MDNYLKPGNFIEYAQSNGQFNRGIFLEFKSCRSKTLFSEIRVVALIQT